jgi:hypothetical protein
MFSVSYSGPTLKLEAVSSETLPYRVTITSNKMRFDMDTGWWTTFVDELGASNILSAPQEAEDKLHKDKFYMSLPLVSLK